MTDPHVNPLCATAVSAVECLDYAYRATAVSAVEFLDDARTADTAVAHRTFA